MSTTEQLIEKYDIVEGFIPLEDRLVYALELKKLDIKAAYEINLFDGVEYVFNKENPAESYLTKKKLLGFEAIIGNCFIQRLNEDASGNTEGVEPRCVMAFKPFPEKTFISGLAEMPLLKDVVHATLNVSSPQDTKLLRKKHENQKLARASQ